MKYLTPVSAIVSIIKPMTPETTLFKLITNPEHPVANSFLPGQFLELSLPGVGEIPVSYCGYPSLDGSVELCIRHLGHVTIPLKKVIHGDLVYLRGPFGRGFPISDYIGQNLLLIAGGLGMAPIRSLLLAVIKNRKMYGRITLLYGAREVGALLFLDQLQLLSKSGEIELRIAVDRPGRCFDNIPGCRVALLPDLLNGLEIDPEQTYAAICGPSVVYPFLLAAVKSLGFSDSRIHFSLERRMKCGIGLCCHCAVGSYLSCINGPVFSALELAGIEGALG